jgi:protein disulfide-isomerase A6
MYAGGRTEPDFVKFLNEKAGTHRTPGGKLDANAGTIAALDEIVAKFTGGASLSDVTAEAALALADVKSNIQNKYAEYYVKVFEKLAKSDSYATKELARLDKILQKGGLAPEKQDEFTSRINILKRFIAKVAGKEEL